ncbi:MAG: radical SAM protein [Myxococcota bacterium]
MALRQALRKVGSALLRRDTKELNRLLNRAEMRLGRERLLSRPYVYAIGVTNACNLRCPLCVTGLRQQQKATRNMDLALFKRIIDRIAPYAELVQLYKWGESLFHPDILEMLRYCKAHGIRTEISSNLNVRKDHVLEGLVIHGLDRLIVSMDGTDQESYARYRVGGDLSLLLENVRKLRQFKQRHGRSHPTLILQFLRNKFTGNQVELLQRQYREWGFDELLVDDMTTLFKDRDLANARAWFEEEEIHRRGYMDVPVTMLGRTCTMLYDTMIIEQDGSIPPCCFSTDPQDDFAHWSPSGTLEELVNAPRFVTARRMFRERHAEPGHPCSACSVFESHCGIRPTWSGTTGSSRLRVLNTGA